MGWPYRIDAAHEADEAPETPSDVVRIWLRTDASGELTGPQRAFIVASLTPPGRSQPLIRRGERASEMQHSRNAELLNFRSISVAVPVAPLALTSYVAQSRNNDRRRDPMENPTTESY